MQFIEPDAHIAAQRDHQPDQREDAERHQHADPIQVPAAFPLLESGRWVGAGHGLWSLAETVASAKTKLPGRRSKNSRTTF